MRSIAITYTPVLTKSIAVLAAITALSIFLYGFFLLEAVAHAAALTDTSREIRTSMTTVSQLEEQYLSLTKDVTRERATELGFVAPANVSTVFANAAARSLSVRGN